MQSAYDVFVNVFVTDQTQRRREPALDIVRVLEVGLGHTPDPAILEWAATEGRILITGDLNTMVGFAWSRVESGQPMPGVVALLQNIGAGRVIDDILLIALCSMPEDMKDQVLFVPF
jgi:uncharacterized protein DUF5615